MTNLVNFILSLIFLTLGTIELACFLWLLPDVQYDKLLIGIMSLTMGYILIQEIEYDNDNQ